MYDWMVFTESSVWSDEQTCVGDYQMDRIWAGPVMLLTDFLGLFFYQQSASKHNASRPSLFSTAVSSLDQAVIILSSP